MQLADKPAFLELLDATLAAYGEKRPDTPILKAWWTCLEPFPLQVVALAFSAYRDEQGDFVPKPAGIAKRCKLMDGRPTADEAWAIAVTSRDEAETVVWTTETAEAFGICAPILQMGDEVGARMAFKDAYNRLVTVARATCTPAKWDVSLGWDVSKREATVSRAQVAGLLAAPTVQALLPYQRAAEPCPEGLKRVKEELARLQDGWARAAARREEERQAEQAAVDKKKREIAQQVTRHQEGKAA